MDDLKNALKELPPVFGRRVVDRLLPGVISSRNLANLDSKGVGPKKYKIGRIVFYRRDEFIQWLEEKIKVEEKFKK